MSSSVPAVSRAIWFDPLRWSWIVRAHAVFLAVGTILEYQKLTTDAFKAWLPRVGENSDGVLLGVSVILLPLFASQLLTLTWMLLVARVRSSSAEQMRPIAELLHELSTRRRGRRLPRVLIGRVAQPHAVSTMSMRFLILPARGPETWRHYLGSDGDTAYRAVLAHELGHFESWDDLLFFPVFIYLAISGGIWLLMAAHLTGIPNVLPAITHLFVLTGLALFAIFVLRRREAYADAFAAMLLADLRPIRRVLEYLPRAGESEPGAVAFHFGAKERLQWVGERGRRFLDLRRADLAVLAMVSYGSLKTGVFAHSSGRDLSGSLFAVTSGMVNFLIDVLFILTIAGWMAGRSGRLPRLRELLFPAAIAAIIPYASAVIASKRSGFAWFAETVMSAFFVMFTEALPFFVIVFMLAVWTRRIILRAGSDTRERVVFFSTLLAAATTSISNLAALAAVGPLTRFIQSLVSTNEFSPQNFLKLVGIAISAITLGGGIFLGIGLWGFFAPNRTGRVACRRCLREAQTISEKLSVSCPRCGALLRTDFGVEVST